MQTFIQHLQQYGPHALAKSYTFAEAQSYCKALAQQNSHLLPFIRCFAPRQLLQQAAPLFAFWWWSRGLAKAIPSVKQAIPLLRWWKQELHHCYYQQPNHPVTTALLPTIQQYQLPMASFQNLLFACEQDQMVKRYRTFDQLMTYCHNALQPLCIWTLRLHHVQDENMVSMPLQFCTALFLIYRWVRFHEDRQRGFVYIPSEDCHHFDLTHFDILNIRKKATFCELVRFDLDRAEDMLFRTMPAFDDLPRELRLKLELLADGYLSLAQKIYKHPERIYFQQPGLHWFTYFRIALGGCIQLWKQT